MYIGSTSDQVIWDISFAIRCSGTSFLYWFFCTRSNTVSHLLLHPSGRWVCCSALSSAAIPSKLSVLVSFHPPPFLYSLYQYLSLGFLSHHPPLRQIDLLLYFHSHLFHPSWHHIQPSSSRWIFCFTLLLTGFPVPSPLLWWTSTPSSSSWSIMLMSHFGSHVEIIFSSLGNEYHEPFPHLLWKNSFCTERFSFLFS